MTTLPRRSFSVRGEAMFSQSRPGGNWGAATLPANFVVNWADLPGCGWVGAGLFILAAIQWGHGQRSLLQESKPNMHGEVNEIAREWFRKLGDACASVDYEAGRSLFAEDVASFGTRADIVVGLDRLQANQWEGIWPNIADFAIDLGSVRGGGDGPTNWGMATWTSMGFDETAFPFHRPGRATVVLERRGGEWLCVHSHFSLNPGTPPRTHGRA